MKVIQSVFQNDSDTSALLEPLRQINPDLLLVFGSHAWLARLEKLLVENFPQAKRLGCSTAGEISQHGVSEGSCIVTAIAFDQVQIEETSTSLQSMQDSHAAGQRLAQGLSKSGLRAVLLFGQGLNINGSALISGMSSLLPAGVLITGGLAGDDAAFKETWVLDSSGVYNDRVACVGLYGEQLQLDHGSFGGWMPFGPARKVTRSVDNVLFELDGEPALDVYKRYLGEHAKDLPASGLLFPFDMLDSDHAEVGLIRTILAIDEAQGSMTLAGDIDPKGFLRLMHASTNALIDGAEAAAKAAANTLQHPGQGLALLVSCVGRKLVMGGRVEEEVEAVADVFGQASVITGFYSYGEISPYSGQTACHLHNQTMTITTLKECASKAAA
jgi:hypothetical protein